MAHFYRVSLSVLLAVFVWYPTLAVATIVPVQAYSYWGDNNNGTQVTSRHPSMGEACKELAGWAGGSVESVTISLCGIHHSVGNVEYTEYLGMERTNAGFECPGTSVNSQGNCVCVPPEVDIKGACSAPVDPNIAKCKAATGGLDMFSGFSSFAGIGKPFCPSDGAASSCAAAVTGAFATVKDGVKAWTYEVAYGGGTCTPPAAAAEPGKQTDCRGTVGTVNGITVCSPSSDRNIVEAIKVTKDVAPTASGAAEGSAGSTEKTADTSCSDGKCSTVTTIRTIAADGTSTTTTEKQELPKEDFCTKNPRAAMCLTSAISSGSCGSADACEGDAILCSIQAQAKLTRCALMPDPGQESLAYDAAKTLTGNQTSNLPGNSTVNISSASFDQTEFLGSPVGAQDLVVTVAGRVITLPISQVNPWLSRLGFILQAVTFLVCLKIVTREG